MDSPSGFPLPESRDSRIGPEHPAYRYLLARSTTSHTSELTLGLLHKFNNLFTGATFLTEACLAKAESGESVAEDLREILKILEHAHRYAERVSQLHVEANEEASYHDLDALVAGEIELVRLLLPQGTTVTHIPSAERLTCYASRQTVSRILLEIAGNCGEAIPKRGGHVTFSTFANPERPGLVSIEIRDNGPGFSDEVLARLFNEVCTTKSEDRHAGLGLIACRLLARSAGGGLAIRNDAESGAIAILSFPEENPEGRE